MIAPDLNGHDIKKRKMWRAEIVYNLLGHGIEKKL